MLEVPMDPFHAGDRHSAFDESDDILILEAWRMRGFRMVRSDAIIHLSERSCPLYNRKEQRGDLERSARV
jgi:hypothetical protein